MAKNTEIPDTKVPSEMLTANLLALLKNWSGYGYELAKKLEEAGYGAYNSGTLYRTLRQMEKNGLISSLWDTSTDGPARRVYSVTSVGTSFLNNWMSLIDLHKSALLSFIDMVAPPNKKSDNDPSRSPSSAGE